MSKDLKAELQGFLLSRYDWKTRVTTKSHTFPWIYIYIYMKFLKSMPFIGFILQGCLEWLIYFVKCLPNFYLELVYEMIPLYIYQSQLFGSNVIIAATHEQALFVPLRTWVSRGMLLIMVFDDQMEQHPFFRNVSILFKDQKQQRTKTPNKTTTRSMN